jgi:glutathione-regulated potassium-efflux system ancillary protein KefG
MKKVLILFAHPRMSRSKINAALRRGVEHLEGVTFHDLYAHYPDFLIDVEHEQNLCEEHDIIIFQHPFYWYSTPSIIKEWFDLVLQHGWAYGSEGRALEGKYLLQALTAGGDDVTYRKGGANLFTIHELTSPCRATANLCRMQWLPPFVVLGIHRGLPDSRISSFAEDYRRAVIALRDETLSLAKVSRQQYLNSDLNSAITSP